MRTFMLELARQRRRAVLLYSVRAAAEAAFAAELEALAAASGGALRVVLTVTGPDPAWAGRRGRIDAALISEQARPQSMMAACCRLLPGVVLLAARGAPASC
jgi:ferredoxin-NADP reductase